MNSAKLAALSIPNRAGTGALVKHARRKELIMERMGHRTLLFLVVLACFAVTTPSRASLTVPVGYVYEMGTTNVDFFVTNYGTINSHGTVQVRGDTWNCFWGDCANIYNEGGATWNNMGVVDLLYSSQYIAGRGNVRAGELTNWGEFHNEGTLRNGANTQLNNYGILANMGFATLQNLGIINNSNNISGGGDYDNSGTLNNFSQLITSGVFNNSGTLNSSGELQNWHSFSNSGTLNNSGLLWAFPGSTLNSSGTFTSSGTLTLENSAELNTWGAMLNSGTLTNSGVLTNSGTFTNTHTLTNAGTLNNTAGTLRNSLRLDNAGTLTNAGGALLLIDYQGTLTNSGVIVNGGTLSISAGGVMSNVEGSTLHNFGAVINSSWLTNLGTLTNSGAFVNYSVVLNGGIFHNSGQLAILETTLFQNTGTYAQSAGSTLVNGSLTSSTAIQITGGTLAGTGTVTAPLLVLSKGATVSPGDPLGVLTLNGNYVEVRNRTAPDILNLTIAGAQAYDKFVVNGKAFLSGELDVVLSNYAPKLGDAFTLMSYRSHAGVYEKLNLPALSKGEQWRLYYTPTRLLLAVAPGSVDAPLSFIDQSGSDNLSDYLALTENQLGYFAEDWSKSLPDEGLDFDANLGDAQPTPEPSTFLLLGSALLATALRRHRRR